MAEARPSKKQRELLNYLVKFITENGYGPSYREVMRALDYKSVSTVAVHVDGLIARGLLRKTDHSARSLEIVGREQLSKPHATDDWKASFVTAITTKVSELTETNKPEAVMHVAYVLRLIGEESEAASIEKQR